MKILTFHSVWDDNPSISGVDWWRIYRPLKELEKHTDWQIDHQRTLIPGFENYKDKKEFTPEELEAAFKKICEYDIVFSSYHADRAGYLLLKVAREKHGVQFVMDVDDNFFSINEDNPFWMKMDDQKTWWLQVMARENQWLTTTTEELANEYRKRRRQKPDNHPDDSVFVVPNYISNHYTHPYFDNGDKIVIGYFGGSSHYDDLNETNVAEALQKLMHENKNVYFKAVGMPFDKYLPKKRYQFVEGKRGYGWINELYPNLKMDIAIAPLKENDFNKGKSNIKWQEATRAGAAFIGTDFGPYASLKPATATLVKNTTKDWYEGLKTLTEDVVKRKNQLKEARKELKENWRLEDQWRGLKQVFETVYKHKEGK